ncbi:MAG: sodium:calcium antiporter [Deltaproteobacteria bacterium]|nr:MAG: sodium:calcium antiporter [Deltaproteobacteria bacterium]
MAEILLNTVLLLLSVALLWKGSDWLVESAARVGHSLGMSDLTIGLTIVAFGTSAPEFAVTISAAVTGRADISVGNVVGSNIFNLGFILGGCSLFAALRAERRMVWRDGGVLVGTALLLLWMLHDRHLSHLEGGILFAGLLAYVAVLFRQKHHGEGEVPTGRATWKDGLLLLLGLAGVVGGGHLLVVSASSLARLFGISEWVIAVTIVAAGTSAPEFATSLMAAAKGRHGMSLGNLIGSDLFNLLGVLGLAGMIRNLQINPGAFSSVAMLAGMCVLVVVFMRTGWRISRWEGLVLIAIGVVRWILDFLL